MYEKLIQDLRDKTEFLLKANHDSSIHNSFAETMSEAADAIEKLLKVASAMHTWIFLHTGDEQAAYDECGLTDEMNAELGYSGQFVIEPPKEST